MYVNIETGEGRFEDRNVFWRTYNPAGYEFPENVPEGTRYVRTYSFEDEKGGQVVIYSKDRNQAFCFEDEISGLINNQEGRPNVISPSKDEKAERHDKGNETDIEKILGFKDCVQIITRDVDVDDRPTIFKSYLFPEGYVFPEGIPEDTEEVRVAEYVDSEGGQCIQILRRIPEEEHMEDELRRLTISVPSKIAESDMSDKYSTFQKHEKGKEVDVMQMLGIE
ncbi:hypothetical protein KY343_00970 [Candidatus Woesearchaeota archaeon]|nr:hypothetical protein [Candidatus Woesearchaeota archaeon]